MSADPLAVRAWGHVAEGYAGSWSARFRPFALDALDALDALAPGPIAVPGCGPAEEAAALAERFPERSVIASDPAPAMLELARARAAEHEGLSVHEGAASELGEVVQDAAAIFCSFTLQLLPDREFALRAWRDALRPGGQVVCVFWPRQREDDAWGHLGRALVEATGKPRPDWVAPLEARLPELGFEVRALRDLEHEIAYESPQIAWDLLRDACSLQVVLQRLGPEQTAAAEATWLADHGLEQRGAEWVHRPRARLWVLGKPR